MKIFKKMVFTLAFGFLTVPAMMATAVEADAVPASQPLLNEVEASLPVPGDDSKVDIVYLLDKDGRPYIISIQSEDESVNRMIQKLVGASSSQMIDTDSGTMGITIYYDNIR